MPPPNAAAFLGQLSAPRHVLDLRPPAGPAGPRAQPPPGPRTRPPGDRAPSPAVLLVSRCGDGEFRAVAELLGRVGVQVVRLDADGVDGADLLVDPLRGIVRVNGRRVRPTVVWPRHFSAGAIEGTGEPARDLFLRESWESVADQLCEVAAVGLRPPRLRTLAQLRLAASFGVAVPATLITTDPGRAGEELRGTRLVIKAAHRHFVEAAPGTLTGVFPAIVARGGPAPAARPGPPVVVQEYVEHDAELRVHYVAGELYGFRVVKTAPEDLWVREDRVSVHVTDPPPGVVRAVRALAGALALRCCAFDFLMRDGEPVFLEMDPDGDWRWIETKAGTTAVTMAVARMLCGLHRAHLPAAAPSPSGGFDLLAFLSGRK
ncbi:hypothetical protein [Planobispora takensis]|uniref:ATP-grasp domain-containing protein n=1 Tax=Planobispora takensis TaxID=1367882 RepID=A0A8J3SUA6_9ACTN|nr:hypothetical protein [Planobispora takensis]GIH99464.1 hypothetical protein Pta02_14730 [Planobispora takensis]